MKRLAFLVEHLGPSQMSYRLVRACHELSASGVDVQCYSLRRGRPPLRPKFALFPASNLAGYSGPVVAVGSLCAGFLAETVGPASRLFYSWHPEWLLPEHRGGDWRRWAASYGGGMPLAHRTAEHAALCESCFGPPGIVLGDFDSRELMKLAIDYP